ncbi:MAG: LamG-like jellyroll fold domain-containing protein, partial [Verrucomicrobiota bacterium]
WSEGYEAVWHLNQTNGLQLDSSGNGNHAVPINFDGDENSPAGFTGGAKSLDGLNDFLAITNLFYDTAQQIQAITVSGWVRTSAGGDQLAMSFDRNEYWRLSIDEDGGLSGIAWDTTTGIQTDDQRPGTTMNDGNWHLLAGTYAATPGLNKSILLDGAVVNAINAHGGLALGSGNPRYGFIGAGSEAPVFNGPVGPPDHINGEIDEFRISSVARSSDWLWAVWINMASNHAFNCFDPVEKPGTPDLLVTKTVDQTALQTGSNLVYTITVTNTGSADASGVIVTDTLPSLVTFIAAVPTPTSVSNGLVRFDLGSLAAGAGTTIVLTGEVSQVATGAVTNTAGVFASGETNLADNLDTAVTTLPDTDNDGLPDFTDPDDDNDLFPDCAELIADTDPMS